MPHGAHAGELTLKPGSYTTENGSYTTENGSYTADSGTLVVSENRADPRSRLIALPITRIHAESDHPAEPIFVLYGGPGITNMEFPQASRFAGNHDVVLVGYRGVDGSGRLDCPEVDAAFSHSADVLSTQSFRAYANAFRACRSRLTAEGVDLVGYGIAQQAGQAPPDGNGS